MIPEPMAGTQGRKMGIKRSKAREIWFNLFKSIVGFLSFFCSLEDEMQPVNAYVCLPKALLCSQFAP